MELFWFAVGTIILAFMPWISAEERLLYQTPNGNRWGGWETYSTHSRWNVIKLAFCCRCFTYPDYKHIIICQRAAFLWCSGYIIVDPPSLSKETFVRRAHFSKYNIYFLPVYLCYFTFIFFKIVLLICMCWTPYCCSLVRG